MSLLYFSILVSFKMLMIEIIEFIEPLFQFYTMSNWFAQNVEKKIPFSIQPDKIISNKHLLLPISFWNSLFYGLSQFVTHKNNVPNQTQFVSNESCKQKWFDILFLINIFIKVKYNEFNVAHYSPYFYD